MVIILSSFRSRSERQGISVDQVVGGLDRLLDQSQSHVRVERAPRPRGRARRFGNDNLRGRSVFDERTGAEAISHGAPPFFLLAASEGGWIGEGMSSPAAGDYL